MMNISQAAAESGLSAKQIRDYEKHGLIAPAARSEAGYRRYGQADLVRLRFIRHAKTFVYPCGGVIQIMAKSKLSRDRGRLKRFRRPFQNTLIGYKATS